MQPEGRVVQDRSETGFPVISVSEIIPAYVYKIGIEQAQFSFSTAVGLFNAVVNVFVLTVHCCSAAESDHKKNAGRILRIDCKQRQGSFAHEQRELNVDRMKIDKYFIDKLLYTEPDKEITSDIISMAHKLGHSTVAEGIEDMIQLKYLNEHGCDKVQGYLISEPLEEKDAVSFLNGRGSALIERIPGADIW